MPIVTISREYGSGGDEIASRLCEELGYHAFGKLQISQAAQETTLSKLNAIDYSEDNHEVKTFLDRLFGRTASPVQKIAWSENPSIASRPEHVDVHDTAVISLVKTAIRGAVKAGNMVIIGRGGQVLLKDTPGVLHVRVEAPVATRIERVKLQLKFSQGAPKSEAALKRAASEIVSTRDTASADYLRQFYNVDWNDPTLYHIVLNLGKLTVEQSVKTLVAAVHSLEEHSNDHPAS